MTAPRKKMPCMDNDVVKARLASIRLRAAVKAASGGIIEP
jgi:hypothetical protein